MKLKTPCAVCAAVHLPAVLHLLSTCAPVLTDEYMHQPSALCIFQSHSHNSSSSSIFVSAILGAGGMLPSEFPLSFCALASVAPKLLRIPSSKPGREARCFLNGEPTVPSVLKSGTDVLGAVDASAVVSMVEAGVPEIGDPEAPRLTADAP
jgi:hypothetical protein